jgi:membrane protein
MTPTDDSTHHAAASDTREVGPAEAAALAALDRLPPRMRETVLSLLGRWPGRILFRSARSCIQIEIFDRSMTIAAQFFTSVFPILIVLVSWFGGAGVESFIGAVDMPEESKAVVEEAVQSSGGATFGLLGGLIVLASATSLARALTRAYTAIWQLPRPRSSLRFAWRWLAVVVSFALSLIVVRTLSAFAAQIPPGNIWQRMVTFVCDLAITVFVPWLLLSGAVRLRRLLPASILFASVMLAVRPASSVWLPYALDLSAARYGSIGVAFTYLAWLYVVAFILLLSAVVGRVVAVDHGWLGRWFGQDSLA